MKIVEVEVQKFRNIVESSFEVEPDVTCLVGKNGSGKTASLHALHRLRPAEGGVTFHVQSHYPAWLEKQDRQRGEDLHEVAPIRAIFSFEEEEIQKVGERFGSKTLQKNEVALARNYRGELKRELSLDERAFVQHVVEEIEWPYGTKTPANEINTVDQLRSYAQELSRQASKEENTETDEESEGARAQKPAQRIERELEERLGERGDLGSAVWNVVEPMIPRFLYFDEYSQLPYTVDIERVLTQDASQLNRGELSFPQLDGHLEKAYIP